MPLPDTFTTLPLQRTVLANGLEFHYVEAGRGAPLVFVHGVMGEWRTWAPQWNAFTPHYRTISYSRRYNQPNRNPQPSPHHSALIEAEDLAELLSTWAASPAILVGASYGAFTALALAVQSPALVQALVLLEPPMLRWADLSPEGQQLRAAFERDIRLPARAAFLAGDDALGLQLLTGGIIGATAAAQQDPAAQQRRQANVHALRQLTLSTDEFPWIAPDAINTITAPTLLLAGAQTQPIHDVVFRHLSAAMPQAQAERIPHAGHGAARENPAAFNRCVLDFLARQGLHDMPASPQTD